MYKVALYAVWEYIIVKGSGQMRRMVMTRKIFIPLFLCGFMFLAPSCGSSSPSQCIGVHPDLSGQTRILSVIKCGKDKWHEFNNTDLKNLNIKTGRFTGKITGVGDLPLTDSAHVLFITGITETGVAQNLRITISGSNPNKPFLVRYILRYYKGSSFVATDSRGTMNFDPGKEYTFDCQWTADHSRCEIFDSARTQTLSLQVALKAPYENLGDHLIRFGSGIVYGQKPGSSARSSGIRVSLYE